MTARAPGVPTPSRPRAGALPRALGVALLALAGAVLMVGLGIAARWPVVSVVETGATAAWPELRPRAWPRSQERVLAAATEALERLPDVTIEEVDATAGKIRAFRAHRVGWLASRMEVRVVANGEGGAIVHVRSETPEARGDLGQNARNIAAVFGHLDDILGASAP